ncbi:hypothetical protein BKH43_06020 [Helicobacter sp. 13S00401-1]|uniref:DedA family protein n=1 Tax=Helicobacter sp. 13S00401-1 TaxID=1905758 RepID=UPI000BA58E40|nr:DedA family protein [Helicobacter sp. 13S00401-1]PAF50047.1 hypothetical protein BKH43_06020 [Helicobacter sp. 13S00401-1]
MDSVFSGYENLGYALLFLYSMGGGYIGILAAGALSAVGKLDLSLSILVAICGNVIASSFYAIFFRYQKKELTKYLRKHRRKVALANIWIKKFGIWMIFICKYLHGIRTIVPIAIGMSKYSLYRFVLVNLIATIIWGVVLGVLGFFASGKLLELIRFMINKPYVIPIVVVAIVVLIVLFYYIKSKIFKKARNKK